MYCGLVQACSHLSRHCNFSTALQVSLWGAGVSCWGETNEVHTARACPAIPSFIHHSLSLWCSVLSLLSYHTLFHEVRAHMTVYVYQNRVSANILEVVHNLGNLWCHFSTTARFSNTQNEIYTQKQNRVSLKQFFSTLVLKAGTRPHSNAPDLPHLSIVILERNGIFVKISLHVYELSLWKCNIRLFNLFLDIFTCFNGRFQKMSFLHE